MKKIILLLMLVLTISCTSVDPQKGRKNDSAAPPCKGCDFIVVGQNGNKPVVTNDALPTAQGKSLGWQASDPSTPSPATFTFADSRVCGPTPITALAGHLICQLSPSLPPGLYSYSVSFAGSSQTGRGSIKVAASQ